MADLTSLSIEEIFKLLESNNSDVVAEIQRFFHENLSETRESWLVSGLYDYYINTGSLNGMKLLANVREPHDKILCDRLSDGLRSGSHMSLSLDLMGYIARKQPTWLHRVSNHQMFKELVKLIKTEMDVTILVPALLVLVSLLPIVAHKVSHLLTDLFETFHRLCVYKHKEKSNLSELSSTHLMVAIYAFFHRLYGMFPCNFLYFMRQQDYESSNCSNIFNDIVSPLLSTVRLHPLLVTHNRDYEKTNARWKGLAEVHDVLAECSRYSQDVYEAGSREEQVGVMSLWSESSTPVSVRGYKSLAHVTSAKLSLDSPPEAAVEATPDNTPYTTPVKDLTATRPPNDGQGSQHVRSLTFKSPGPSSPTKTVMSPTKESSLFKFPEVERRDSLFGDGALPSHPILSKRDSLGLGIPSLRLKMTGSVDPETEASRPSPVKFTSAPPLLSSESRYNMDRAKLLSLTDAQDTGDQAREETDAEVSSITGSVSGLERPHGLGTRHITPQMFSESANTSRTMSRISQPDTEMCEPDKCEPGRNTESVSQLVTKVMRRVRRITLCESGEGQETDTQGQDGGMKRCTSCPNITMELNSKLRVKSTPNKNKLRFSSGTQTDPSLNFLPYETLFPHALPILTNPPSGKPLPAPQQLLGAYIDNVYEAQNIKDLSSQIKLLRSQLLFETGRREILGARNRRLLGFTKNVRELEEQNLALVDKLHLAGQEISTLHTQLAKVRTGKHQAETERVEAGKLQDSMIQKLQSKLEEVRSANRELTENNEYKEMQLLETNANCDKVRSELFQAQAKIAVFQKKEESWQTCQADLDKMKIKCMLQGELVVRQIESLEKLSSKAKEEEMKMFQLASSREIEGLKASILCKSQELTLVKAKVQELENKVTELTEGVKSQQEMIDNIHVEHKERLEAVESRHRAVRSINSHLEITIMELQAARVRAGPGRRVATSQSEDSIDVMQMSSMSASLGSDTGEHIRRAMDSQDSPPVDLGREILGLEIPRRSSGGAGAGIPIGSAYSALHGSHSSQNGNSH